MNDHIEYAPSCAGMLRIRYEGDALVFFPESPSPLDNASQSADLRSTSLHLYGKPFILVNVGLSLADPCHPRQSVKRLHAGWFSEPSPDQEPARVVTPVHSADIGFGSGIRFNEFPNGAVPFDREVLPIYPGKNRDVVLLYVGETAIAEVLGWMFVADTTDDIDFYIDILDALHAVGQSDLVHGNPVVMSVLRELDRKLAASRAAYESCSNASDHIVGMIDELISHLGKFLPASTVPEEPDTQPSRVFTRYALLPEKYSLGSGRFPRRPRGNP